MAPFSGEAGPADQKRPAADPSELAVSVRMLPVLDGLAVRLEAVAEPARQAVHGALAHPAALRLKQPLNGGKQFRPVSVSILRPRPGRDPSPQPRAKSRPARWRRPRRRSRDGARARPKPAASSRTCASESPPRNSWQHSAESTQIGQAILARVLTWLITRRWRASRNIGRNHTASCLCCGCGRRQISVIAG